MQINFFNKSQTKSVNRFQKMNLSVGNSRISHGESEQCKKKLLQYKV